jgi:large subunit ribosomal protein L2
VVEVGEAASPKTGNVMTLGKIPEGTMIFNVEKRPGDGGKFARSGGTYAVVIGQKPEENKTIVRLPSGRTVEVDSRGRATVGIVAGGGRIEKPLLKAGKKYYRAKAKAWKYPLVRGKAMSPYAHPHGGGSHQKGGTPVPKTASPGQKVGFVGSRCTGRGCVRARAQQKQ